MSLKMALTSAFLALYAGVGSAETCTFDSDCSGSMTCNSGTCAWNLVPRALQSGCGYGSCTESSDCCDSYICSSGSCTVCQANVEEEYTNAIIPCNVIAIIIGIILMVVMALPVCCGMCTADGTLSKVKIVAGVVIGISLFNIFLPAIGGAAGMSAALDAACEECPCDDAERKKYEDDLAALGIIVAYLAYGFIAVIFSIVAMCLACCGCCPCCGPLQKVKMGTAGGAAPAAVGVPVGNGPCSE